MGLPGWDADNIVRRKLATDSALDSSVALFAGSHRLSIHQRAAHHSSRRSGLHEEDVDLSFMPLGLAVGLLMNQRGAVVGKIRQQLDRKMMGVADGVQQESQWDLTPRVC